MQNSTIGRGFVLKGTNVQRHYHTTSFGPSSNLNQCFVCVIAVVCLLCRIRSCWRVCCVCLILGDHPWCVVCVCVSACVRACLLACVCLSVCAVDGHCTATRIPSHSLRYESTLVKAHTFPSTPEQSQARGSAGRDHCSKISFERV
jgi:hypothetical protein